MANDVEMNDVQKPLMKDTDIDNVPEVEFKSLKHNTETIKKDSEFRGLTKEELEKFAKDPFWMRLRLILFILFWIIWVIMLVAAILIVVYSKKCPKRPKLDFWQQKTGYWVDPYAYVDSDQNYFGDFKGIATKLNYIQKEVGAGYLILDSIFNKNANNFAERFQSVDPNLGSLESFKDLVKDARKIGIEIVLSADLIALSMNSASKSYLIFNEELIEKIKESIKMWLNFGVRGFLFTNIENSTIQTTNICESSLKINSKRLLNEIRKTMDEVAKSTDKTRLLIVDAGDFGLGLDKVDPLLQYLGKKENLADMVIGREFLKYRGWSTKCRSGGDTSISNYLLSIPSDKRTMIGLTSTTSSSPRTDDLLKIVSPFLVEGNPIIYYGSEVGMTCDGVNLSNSSLPYPSNSILNPCNHMIMPWDNTGDEFFTDKRNKSSNFFSQYKDTVQSLTAVGTGENIFKLHGKLKNIRKEPSLQWGTTKVILNESMANYSHDIFIREAAGFPIIIVALLQDKNYENTGKVFSFKLICEKFTPILVYPSNVNLEENKEVDTKNVFLKMEKTGSVYVFKCSE